MKIKPIPKFPPMDRTTSCLPSLHASVVIVQSYIVGTKSQHRSYQNVEYPIPTYWSNESSVKVVGSSPIPHTF